MLKNIKFGKSELILHTIIIISAIFFALPVLWVIFSSVKERFEFNEASFFPHSFHLENYVEAFITRGLYKYYFNSILFTSIATSVGVFICLLSAFALTRLRFKYSKQILMSFVVVIMLPGQLTLIPLFILYKWFHIINTPHALILSYTWMLVPFGTFISYGYLKSLSFEIDEAARMDGANSWILFTRIILPMCTPIISALVISQSLIIWNEFMVATTFVNEKWYTLPVGIIQSNETAIVANHPVELAGTVCTFILPLILFLSMQKLFIKGITGGMSK